MLILLIVCSRDFFLWCKFNTDKIGTDEYFYKCQEEWCFYELNQIDFDIDEDAKTSDDTTEGEN